MIEVALFDAIVESTFALIEKAAFELKDRDEIN